MLQEEAADAGQARPGARPASRSTPNAQAPFARADQRRFGPFQDRSRARWTFFWRAFDPWQRPSSSDVVGTVDAAHGGEERAMSLNLSCLADGFGGACTRTQTKLRQCAVQSAVSNAAKFSKKASAFSSRLRREAGHDNDAGGDSSFLRGLRHRHRDGRRGARSARLFRGLQSGRHLDHPALWRDRAGAGPQSAPSARMMGGGYQWSRASEPGAGIYLHAFALPATGDPGASEDSTAPRQRRPGARHIVWTGGRSMAAWCWS